MHTSQLGPVLTKMDSGKDAWEPWADALYDPAIAREVSGTVRIEYVDSNGNRTLRDVAIERYAVTATGGLLLGRCKLRGARRTFQLARIRSAECMATRSRIPDLTAWLDHKYRLTPNFARDRFLEEFGPALGALHAIAKADGALRSGEREIIERFIRNNSNLPPRALALVLGELENWPAPSAVKYGRDLRELSNAADDVKAELVAAAEEMLRTDLRVKDSELHAMNRMRKALGLVVAKSKRSESQS